MNERPARYPMPEHGPIPEPMDWIAHDQFHENELHRDRPAYRVPGHNDQRKYLLQDTDWTRPRVKLGAPLVYQCGHGMCRRYVWANNTQGYVSFADRHLPLDLLVKMGYRL